MAEMTTESALAEVRELLALHDLYAVTVDRHVLETLVARCEALQADAERYRFATDEKSRGVIDYAVVRVDWTGAQTSRYTILRKEEADAAIDAARSEGV